eukprot:GILJ01009784.1.p1 GENE.GILJ01009784.1~~GILJ01009784.1.p1  ORF type:complete len:370 (-),score=45.46 GILJ01009784.1:613-1722(-)
MIAVHEPTTLSSPQNLSPCNPPPVFSRNNGRPTRKVPAFSITVPEREVVGQVITSSEASKKTSKTTSKSTSGAASPSMSPDSSSSSGFKAMVSPSGYHEQTFGTSAFQATRLLPLLYLGNEGDAALPHELRHRNIKRILNVAFDCATQDYEAVGIQVLHLPLRDCGDEDIGSHFDRCSRFIHEGITNNEGVIVHCRLGVSRSATIAIAYLMTYGIFTPTRVLTPQRQFRVVPLSEQQAQGSCRTCLKHGRTWLHYEDNGERINNGQFHIHPEESPEGKCYTDYGDVFTYVSMRRENISPNIGFAMQLRKLNVDHGFRDFLSEMSPGPSDDYCCSTSVESNSPMPAAATSCFAGGLPSKEVPQAKAPSWQ